MTRCVIVISLLLVTAACGGRTVLGGSSAVRVVDSAMLAPPDRGDLNTSDRPYLIGAFDKLSISVFGIGELSNQEVQTDASGRFSFPLIGVIEAAGKSPPELAELIEGRLRGRYVKSPQVTINLKETVSQVVTVDGQVREPGLYPVVGRMTLMRAIATAKGLGEFEKLEEVVVFRTVKGQRYAALYDLKSIRTGAYDDPDIYANDIIVVGDTPSRRFFKDLAPIIAAPLVVALQTL